VPEHGGNIQTMKNLMGSDKFAEMYEYTFMYWKDTPHELMLLNILLDFEKYGKSVILSYDTYKMGISYLGHKKVNGVVQLLYTSSVTHGMS
jgi:hypothetical protein